MERYPTDGLCFRGKELGWDLSVCLGEGSVSAGTLGMERY